MKCPTCPDTTLNITNRQGVEVDYCPDCRGVWLDRGELDKVIERALTEAPPAHRNSESRSERDFVDSDHRGVSRHRDSRRKSWLSEIFD